MCYIIDPLVLIFISVGSWGGLTFIMLDLEIWGELDRVALKVEMGSGVGDLEKQCGVCCFVVLVCVWVYFCCCS
jgi:hypothetical protein